MIEWQNNKAHLSIFVLILLLYKVDQKGIAEVYIKDFCLLLKFILKSFAYVFVWEFYGV